MKLLNPRGYISWQQVNTLEQSVNKYIEKYIYGKQDDIETPAMKLGKRFSDALESGKPTGDEILDLMVSMTTKYKYREYEIKEVFKSKQGDITLLGKIDTFEESPHIRFREYKTGATKWTQKKAEEHGQVYHYASLIWLKYKKLPSEVWLDHMPSRSESDGEYHFTGESIRSFKINISIMKVMEYLARVTKVAVTIDEIYRKALNIK